MLNLLLNLTVGVDPKLSSLLMMAIDLLTDVAQVKDVLVSKPCGSQTCVKFGSWR
jgi:hypothetical protein